MMVEITEIQAAQKKCGYFVWFNFKFNVKLLHLKLFCIVEMLHLAIKGEN